MSAPPPSQNQFSDLLWDGWPLVKQQTDIAMKTFDQYAEFFKKREKCERDYIASLKKLADGAPEEVEKGMVAGNIYQELLNTVKMEVEYRTQALQRITEDVVEPMRISVETFAASKKSLLEKGTALHNSYTSSLNALKESRLEYYKCHNDAEVAKLTLEESKRALAADPDAFNPAKIQKMEARLLSLSQDMTMSNNLYKSQIKETNDVQFMYFSLEGMGKILNGFQTLETVRIQKLKIHFQKYCSTIASRLPVLEKNYKDFEARSHTFDTKKDIQIFLQKHKSKDEPPVPWEYEPYVEGYAEGKKVSKISSMMWKIKKGVSESNSTGNQGTIREKEEVASTFLGKPMESLPQTQVESIRVPLFLVEICNFIENNGGFGTEGIFRQRPGASEFDEGKSLAEKGLYGLKPGLSVHVGASLLKLWLRELPEPLIPSGFYDRAVLVSRDDEIKPIFDGLPSVHQSVVTFLAQFLNKLALPEYAEETKMNSDNLAMVFAPSFLRTPRLDLMLSNADKEKMFVKCLLQYIARSSPVKTNSSKPSTPGGGVQRRSLGKVSPVIPKQNSKELDPSGGNSSPGGKGRKNTGEIAASKAIPSLPPKKPLMKSSFGTLPSDPNSQIPGSHDPASPRESNEGYSSYPLPSNPIDSADPVLSPRNYDNLM